MMATVIVIFAIFVKMARPSIGHINQMFQPHAHTLLLNPGSAIDNAQREEFAWTERIRKQIPQIYAEVSAVEQRGQGKMMQPHEAFLSKAFAGGVDLNTHTDDETAPVWDWGMIRAGTIDTCLASHLPITMSALETALIPEEGSTEEKKKGTLKLHTAFLSRLGVGRVLPPHCGETRGLWRLIIALDGPSVGPVARQSVLNDHNACTRRFAKPCPVEYSNEQYQQDHGLNVSTVIYGVGDVLLFNDFCCHWVEYLGSNPRLALIINVDRSDYSQSWQLSLLGWISKVFMKFRGGAINRASENSCAHLM